MIEELSPGVVVVGTAHVAQSSVDEVEATLRERKPHKVLVELDERRFEALQDPAKWQQTDIVQVIRQKKQHLFLLQVYLAAMQAQMGRDTGVAPGGEMLRAIQVADEIGAEVVLIDREISITLKRGFGSMSFWQRLRLFWNVWMQVLTPVDEERLDVEDILETDAITQMTEEFARFAPKVKTALIDERDQYMASHIRDATTGGQTAVAIVGAGHMPGIRHHYHEPDTITPREELDEVPKRRFSVGKLLAYLVPAFIIGLFVYMGVTGDIEDLKANLLKWVLINGVLSALGALLARGHILSVLVAFIAAPITSLNPLLAAGWFAGLTEAWVHTPTVKDFEAIKHLENMKDFWRNDVVRVVLVTALANLGSVAGTYIAGAQIVQSVFGGG